MRDTFVLLVVLVSLPYAVVRPFVGLLVFTWLAYMRPQDLCWTFVRDLRLSYYVAVAMFVGYLANEYHKRRFATWDVRSRCMVLMFAATSLSTLFAKRQDETILRYYMEFAKILAVALFTTGQVDSRVRLKALLWTIALSLGFYGIKNGLMGILSGGSPIQRGPGGMLEDNNDFSLALVMNMPLLLYLGFDEQSRWIRRAAVAGVVLTMFTVLLTHSRGGFLAMCAVVLVFVRRANKLGITVFGIALAVAAFFTVVPEHVRERIALIGEGTEESSARARWTAWTIAYRMIVDNPLLGVGMRNFRTNWKDYCQGLTAPDGFAYEAHNSYLQIWAEGGTIQFLMYLTMLASTWFALRRLSRATRGRPELYWIWNYARMFEASGVGFLVGSTFLNRGHFDLIYHLVAIVSAFLLIAAREIAAVEAGGTPSRAATGPPRVVDAGGVGVGRGRRWGAPLPMPGPLPVPVPVGAGTTPAGGGGIGFGQGPPGGHRRWGR